VNGAEKTFMDGLTGGGRSLGLDLEKEGVDRLLTHFRLLCKWAERVNLTTISDPGEMAELLYLDSAVLQKYLPEGARLHDVGTGAGFPGLVVAALRPDVQVTLTEARRKKVSFLKQAAREMGVTSMEIRHRRLGWDDGSVGEQWPEVVSRAAFPPPEWIRQGAPLVAAGGRLWICSGTPHPRVDDEDYAWLEELEENLPEGFSPGPVHEYILPQSGRHRRLVTLIKSN
jgi:16S rRNA (guanine527-N7)-methyltransferase